MLRKLLKTKKGIVFLLFVIPFLFILLVVGGLYLFYRYQVKIYASFWETNNKTVQLQPKTFLYIALGDSSAQGIGASSPLQGYVGQFAKQIEAKEGKRVQIINLSKSGARIDNVITQQLPELKKYNPDIITISIGANDVNDEIEEEELAKRLTKLASLLPPKTLFADVAYFHLGKKEIVAKSSQELVQKLSQRYDLVPVPLYEVTRKHHPEAGQYSFDNFHPNDKGYTFWVEAFWEAWKTFPQDFANSNYGVHHGVIVLGIVTVIRAIADMFAGLDFIDEAEYRETTKRSVH